MTVRASSMRQVCCPRCGAEVPFHEGWVSWCNCGWNLSPLAEQRPAGLLEGLYRDMDRKYGEELFERLLRSGPAPPSLRPSRLLLLGIAVFVMLLYLALPVSGVLLVIRYWPNGFALAGGLVLFLIAFVLRPRSVRVSKGSVTSPGTHPELHIFIGRLANHMRTARPRRIVLDEGHGAWLARSAWRPGLTLGIGVPTFYAMGPACWVAQAAHELAHRVSGDVPRSWPVEIALHTLEGWYRLLRPGSLDEYRSTRPSMLDEPQEGLGGFLGLVLIHGLSWIPRGLLIRMVHLAWPDHAQAEYYADLLGAEASGTAAYVSMLETEYDPWLVEDAIHRVMRDGTRRDVMREIRHQAESMPERARERRGRRAAAERTAIDALHPATGLRIRMLRERPTQWPEFMLSSSEVDRIEREIQEDVTRVERRLLADHDVNTPM